MTVPIAVSPSIATHDARASYITVQEFKDSPTAVELDNLVIGGSQLDQDEALAVAIERASSWADSITLQVLAATVDTAYHRARVRPDGSIRLPLAFKPVLAVLGISTGAAASQLSPITNTLDIIIGEHGVVEFTAFNVASGYWGGGLMTTTRPLVQVTYVNGWPNTLTSGVTAAGAVSLPILSATGIYAGTALTIYDGAVTEHVVVAAGYVSGALTLPLTTPLQFAHGVAGGPGVSVSALPPKVKQAVVLLTASLIETEGTDSIVLSPMVDPSSFSGAKGASSTNIALATDMLNEFKRIW